MFFALIWVGCTDKSTIVNPPQESPKDSLQVPLDSSKDIQLPFIGGAVSFTEVDPLNISYKDHEGNDAGWVELFNTSADTVDLNGLYLTDSKSDLKKWKFGNVKIAPYEFLVVFMSAKNLPDFEAPKDSFDLIGPGCWTWTDAENDPAGFSYAKPLPEKSKNCFKENGERRFGATMKFGENEDLGWTSISVFVGTKSSAPEDVLDISLANEIVMNAFITKDRTVSFILSQPNLDDWKGYEIKFKGTGDSSTVYRAILPVGKTFPDLKNIYGTRMSPATNETQEVSVKVFSYIARYRGHEPHSNFKLNKKGGSLFLLNENGEILDSLNYPEIPIGKSYSYGLLANGNATFGFADPTPNGYTTTSVVLTQSPAIDTTEILPSGFYSSPFMIDLKNSNVHCEKGGFEPTPQSPLVSSVLIENTTTLRCASFEAEALRGEEMIRTYIFENQPKMPTVFLTADPNSLFDPDSGIYMEGNFAQEKVPHYGANYWLDKEVPTLIEFFEPYSSEPNFTQKAGLKIFGNYSRQNDKKSVSLTFKEKYGDNRLHYTLFPDFPELKKFKVFILRNNGSNFNNDYIRDRLASSISEGLGVDYQRGRSAIVYYNGEYFGIHNIRERSTEYYFETHYNIDPENIDLLKADNSASAGSSADYVSFMHWLNNNHLDNEENYAFAKMQIDVDNFINYMHTEIYANNRDWPSNNLKKWRVNTPKSLWKWFLYDLDFGMNYDISEYKNNIFEFASAEDGEDWPNGPESTLLFRRLLENENFKNAFVNRLLVLLKMNFNSSRVLNRVNELMAEIESEIPRDQKRWNLSSRWMEISLENIKDFIKGRPDVLYKEIQEFFGVESYKTLTLSTEGSGYILVHNLKIDNNLQIQFAKNIPINITAQESAGGVFVGWSDGVFEKNRIVNADDFDQLTAIFK